MAAVAPPAPLTGMCAYVAGYVQSVIIVHQWEWLQPR